MKIPTLLPLLPLLGLALALPAIQSRETPANVTMSPRISLQQAAAMGAISLLESTKPKAAAGATIDSALDAPTDPINENGLSGACKDVTVLFAKGTGEDGNMGDGSSPGPAWAAAIRASLGEARVTVQGIAYNADVWG